MSSEGRWMKGDRINGLDVRVPILGDLRINRGMFEEKVVWKVNLDLAEWCGYKRGM